MDSKYKILVIDDSSTHVILCETMFENEKFDVIVATSGKDGLKKANKFLPDIILLDLMMPEMDGFDVLKTIKSNPKTQNIPVIVVSAKDQTEAIILAKELGALDYVNKPIGANNLYNKVNQILQSI